MDFIGSPETKKPLRSFILKGFYILLGFFGMEFGGGGGN